MINRKRDFKIEQKTFCPFTDITLYLCSWEVLFNKISNIDLILTSPPYNIGSKSQKQYGCRSVGKYDPKSFGAITGYEDNMPEEEYQQSQKNFLIACSKIINENGVIAYNHKNRHKNLKLISPYLWFPFDYLTLHEEIILDRGSSHNNEKSFLQPTTERLYIFKKSRKSKIYFDKTKNESYKSIRDVWDFTIIRNKGSDKSVVNKSVERHCAPFHFNFAKEVIFRYCLSS